MNGNKFICHHLDVTIPPNHWSENWQLKGIYTAITADTVVYLWVDEGKLFFKTNAS